LVPGHQCHVADQRRPLLHPLLHSSGQHHREAVAAQDRSQVCKLFLMTAFSIFKLLLLKYILFVDTEF
jgi:hypothetical protein